MIERSGYVSYANCGLPYYVGGVIKEQEELTLQTPESFWDRFRIDVRVRQEVTAINPTEKTVTVHALDSGCLLYTSPSGPSYGGVPVSTGTVRPDKRAEVPSSIIRANFLN